MPDNDYDPTEWNPSDDPTDYPEFWKGDDSAESIVNDVIDGKASDAKAAIYAALYRKAGEQIDSMRSEIRQDIDLSSVDDGTAAETLSTATDEQELEIPFGNEADDQE